MKRLHNIFYKLSYFLCRLLLPIKEDLVVFESDEDFSDNSWVLYNYIKDIRTHYKFVWLVHSEQNVQTLSANTKSVFHHYVLHSLKDILVLSRAKYFFYTHGFGICFKPRNKQIVMNLWHGIPVKALKGGKGKPDTKPVFNYLLCLGDANAPLIAKMLRCDIKYAIPLGFPRNDLLLREMDKGVYNPFVPENFRGKVIIWMPTFRKSTDKRLSEESCDNETGLPLLENSSLIKKFNQFLSTINVCVLVKIHHLQAYKETFKHDLSNIVFVTNADIKEKGLQLYQILAKTDALITDYSSVFFDYLLLDRPIGFILDDMEKYQKSRGEFLYNPVTDLLAGKHIFNLQQLSDFCSEVYNEIDSTCEVRRRIADKMIKYRDADSCKRIVDFLEL